MYSVSRLAAKYTIIILDRNGYLVEEFTMRLEEIDGEPLWWKALRYIRRKYGPVHSVELAPETKTLFFILK